VKKMILTVFVLLSLIFPVVTANSDQIISINLSTIVSSSDVAFKGKCESKEAKIIYPEKYPNGLGTAHYVFLVEDVLKGDVKVGDHFAFDQINETRESSRAKGIPYVGTVSYEVGKVYTVFLSKPSSIGLRFPPGADQSVFNVITDASGKTTIVNTKSNKGLFNALPVQSVKVLKSVNIDERNPPSGPINYDDFKTIVEGMQQ